MLWMIYEHVDSNDKLLAIYLDLQKAFDCIDHNILLYIMNHIGIRGTVYNWFKITCIIEYSMLLLMV